MTSETGTASGGAVEVVLLGELEIRGAQTTITASAFGGRRADVVLARLALDSGRTVSREALADAVWGDHAPSSWKPALRNVITSARRALAAAGASADAITSVGDGYRLSLPAGSTVDLVVIGDAVEGIEAALREGDFESSSHGAKDALGRLAEPALAGAEGRWVDGVRAEAQAVSLRLERVVGEAALELGDAERAERIARRLIEATPLREDAHRLLMRALRATGNRGQALAAYDACRRLLADELGIAPSPATEALFLEALAEEHGGRPLTGTRRVTATAAGSLLRLSQQTPFVGREALLDHLVARLRVASDAGTYTVAISGEPGLGKTRLAAELAARAHTLGMSVLYGRADDRIAVAYESLLDALDSALGGSALREVGSQLGEHADVLGRLLPSLAAIAHAPDPAGSQTLDQRRVEQAIVAAFGVVAGEFGALLVLDDMQWVSRREARVLEAIAHGSAGLLMVILHRGADDAAALIGAQGLDARIERTALQPLSAAEIAELAQIGGHTADAATDDDDTAHSLWRLSGGNPLLASELLRAWQSSGEHERMTRIDELVRHRLAPLPALVGDLLRIAAVAGLEFDPALVVAASSAEQVTALDAVQSALAAGLLVPAARDPEWLAFRHALVRESLLESLDPQTKLQIHQRLGLAIESDDVEAAAGLVSLAYHFSIAAPLGEWRRALRYGLPVAHAAYKAGIYEDVISVATRTLEALQEAGDPSPRARLDLQILLGGAQRAIGEAAGHETLSGVFAAARELGEPARMADAALAFSHAGALTEEAFLDDALLPYYEQALEALGESDPHRQAQLLGHVASAYSWRQSAALAQQPADQALALARRLGDDATLSSVLTTARRALTGSGQLEEQLRLEAELLAVAERLDDTGQRVSTAQFRFDSAVELGDGSQLEDLLFSADEISGSLRMGNYHHSLGYARGALALLRGRPDEADVLVERAAAIGRERGLDAMIVEAIRMIQMMGVRHEQGRLRELREEAADFFTTTGVPEWLGAVAFIDGELGRLGEIEPNLDALLGRFAAGGARLVTPIGFAAHMAAPIARLGDRARAAALYDIVVPFAGRGAYFAYFGGPMDYHLGLLARTLGNEHEAAEWFAQAIAFCERLGAPRWLERCEAAASSLARV